MKDRLDSLFRGIAHVLQVADRIAQHVPEDEAGAVNVAETGSTGISNAAQAVYGVSVRIGPRVAPPRRRMATLRQNARKEPVIDDRREPAVDLLDEGDHYIVVAELPGTRESDVGWSVRDRETLVIRADAEDRSYYRELRLGEPVDDQKVAASYANGVLELRLWKQFPR